MIEHKIKCLTCKPVNWHKGLKCEVGWVQMCIIDKTVAFCSSLVGTNVTFGVHLCMCRPGLSLEQFDET